jgi:hypothetical protein
MNNSEGRHGPPASVVDRLNGLPADLKKGDPLVLVTYSPDEPFEQVTVARVGRSYVYIDLGHAEGQFHLPSGIARGNVGYTRQLHTPQQHAELQERKQLFAELRTAGVEIVWNRAAQVTTQQLRALLGVVRPGNIEGRR